MYNVKHLKKLSYYQFHVQQTDFFKINQIKMIAIKLGSPIRKSLDDHLTRIFRLSSVSVAKFALTLSPLPSDPEKTADKPKHIAAVVPEIMVAASQFPEIKEKINPIITIANPAKKSFNNLTRLS